jgi:hypothetical protein
MYLWISGDNFERWMSDGNNRGLVSLDLTPGLQSDEALNDSDKTFTVPALTEWIVKWLWVEFTSTAVVGNRQLEIQLQDDAADVIGEFKAGAAQAASLTYYYMFAPQVGDLTAVRDSDYLSTPIPELILPASYVIRVWDNAAVDAAADDMILQCMVLARTV